LVEEIIKIIRKLRGKLQETKKSYSMVHVGIPFNYWKYCKKTNNKYLDQKQRITKINVENPSNYQRDRVLLYL